MPNIGTWFRRSVRRRVQDVYCDPSPLQRLLYEDFSQSSAVAQIASDVAASSSAPTAGAEKAPHVFTALQYLRKLCSHPLMVLDRGVPAHVKAVSKVLGTGAWSDWTSPTGNKGAELARRMTSSSTQTKLTHLVVQNP